MIDMLANSLTGIQAVHFFMSFKN